MKTKTIYKLELFSSSDFQRKHLKGKLEEKLEKLAKEIQDSSEYDCSLSYNFVKYENYQGPKKQSLRNFEGSSRDKRLR